MTSASAQHEGSARALFVVAPGQCEIREVPLAAPSPGEVRVRTLFSAVSRGTESLVFHGRVPESEWQRMRAPFQSGDFSFPVKYGYISVGEIETGALRGRRVFCLHPHQDRYVVSERDCRPVPDDVPSGRAVLAANMETAVNALWDARPSIGDRVSVIGAGVVGALTAYLCARIAGCEVELIDVDPRKAAVARALGVPFSLADAAQRERDLVLHASGSPDGLVHALSLAGQEARIVELSFYGDKPVTLPLGQAFHARRIQIVSSQVGTIPAHQGARWSYGRRMALALRLLSDDALDALISGESSFDELPRVMPEVLGGESAALCHRVRYV